MVNTDKIGDNRQEGNFHTKIAYSVDRNVIEQGMNRDNHIWLNSRKQADKTIVDERGCNRLNRLNGLALVADMKNTTK